MSRTTRSTQTTKRTEGTFTFADWKEEELSEGPSPKLARAHVTNHYSGGIEAADTDCAYTFVYLEDGTGSFTGFQRLSGTLDGRAGTFILEERGTFLERGEVRCGFEVVSGTEELTGLRGTGRYVAVPGEPSVAYVLEYTLP
ncbi:MAG TPA: DUF3224 domain-containing protein [Nocardiopsis listeri]|uniref:DUF3224 domain-containing protein n=1 Tax=Nocardiopsis listeri TaxID=53440 RepID=UPI001DB3DCEE|nr:DUF3224 domain-containing protein [Nocardiopsis listeri]HJE60875.1 DUF3224 domain-containing protein [Nocardiopsis listeri]